MDRKQVRQAFHQIDQEAQRDSQDRVEKLAYTIGWMQNMIEEAACHDVPMREIVERMLRRESEHV